MKEKFAIESDRENDTYGWTGPLDYRTTPMCYYLQTGGLRKEDIEALEKAGHTVEELPEIPERGLTLSELKDTSKKLASLFGYDMVTYWVMHPGCRHTFMNGDRSLSTIASDEEIRRYVEKFKKDDRRRKRN